MRERGFTRCDSSPFIGQRARVLSRDQKLVGIKINAPLRTVNVSSFSRVNCGIHPQHLTSLYYLFFILLFNLTTLTILYLCKSVIGSLSPMSSMGIPKERAHLRPFHSCLGNKSHFLLCFSKRIEIIVRMTLHKISPGDITEESISRSISWIYCLRAIV